ncbi:ribonuclease P protein component [Piscinibacter sp. XHJ-5]|uniref:ribonuclease P protein component n=1 Tax=Piscinibacter sp. XHJ-5 TaxID=3037797 RepID=UPI00245337E3|nr:ribonuclease P protein component [Piscinibacter sp. XHJ-5]
MIGRIVRSADFERVLSAPTRARTSHFALHHLQARPGTPSRRVIPGLSTELSTGSSAPSPAAVDDPDAARPPDRVWLGAVVPKRHARRAVTRSLLKRQIRAAVGRQPHLPAGLWVVRLRAPFAREQFTSAASAALSAVARLELDTLLADAVRRSPSA